MDDLIKKVWENPKFKAALDLMELAWLERETGVEFSGKPTSQDAIKLIQAAAILSCSTDIDHRKAAYRAATFTYDLFNEDLGLERALRIILVRMGNFPAVSTKQGILKAIEDLPWQLAAEEFLSSSERTVKIQGLEITFTDFQKSFWKKLSDGNSLAVSAPTSAGKSFILQSFIASLLEKEKVASVVYIVPTRALISQVSADFAAIFSRISIAAPEIITLPLDEDIKLPPKAVYVLTQERVQLLLQAHLSFVADIVVADEAHSIQEGSRGVLLHWVIDDLLARKPDLQILFASPLTRNLQIFGRLFGRPDVSSLSTAEATVSQNFIFIDTESGSKGKIRIHSGVTFAETTEVGKKKINATLASRVDKLVHLPLDLAADGAALIYANGAAEAEKIALQNAQKLNPQVLTPKRQALAQLAKETVHESFVMADCVLAGVGFHYANIPAQLRLAVEDAFKRGELQYLVSTSTLLQGVNLPAKSLFICSPEKGRSNPIASTDFWNLSGRAGRLRKEFQGNIFLVDYDGWKSKPLEGPKGTDIRPAIEMTITDAQSELIEVITNSGTIKSVDKSSKLESSFVRLLSDLRNSSLNQTLNRLGVDPNSSTGLEVSRALIQASNAITLPSHIIKRASNISAHKQQKLYVHLEEVIKNGGAAEAAKLIPAHPREEDAFNSYARILEMCHRMILDIDTSKKLHRFHALMAVRWMKGMPLPVIIQLQIDKQPKVDKRGTIRGTLDIIEGQIRYEVARLFSCYTSLLLWTFNETGNQKLADSIPNVSLYLEAGASDQSMVSFISMGLSRVSARKLNDEAADKSMSVEEAKLWLGRQRLDSLGLSPFLLGEIEEVLRRDKQKS